MFLKNVHIQSQKCNIAFAHSMFEASYQITTRAQPSTRKQNLRHKSCHVHYLSVLAEGDIPVGTGL